MGEATAGQQWCSPGRGIHKTMINNDLQSNCPAMRTVRRRHVAHYRLWWAGVGLTCLAILSVGACLKPHPAGVGTHEQLGLPACGFYEQTGYPCPTCGMTTALAHMARGHVFRAFVVQPAGALAALVCMAGVIVGGYTVATGRPPNIIWLWIHPIRSILAMAGIVTISWLWLCLLMYLGQH